MPGTVPGPGNEAVNKTDLVPGPKGQKTDKQVITVWCDETDSPGPQAAELSGWGTGIGEQDDFPLYPLLRLLDFESCECIAYPQINKIKNGIKIKCNEG